MLEINNKFDKLPRCFYFQAAVLGTIIFIVLVAMGKIANTAILGAVGVTSLSSSAFIAFALPNSQSAHFKNIIVSYLIAIVVGISFYYIGLQLTIMQTFISYDTVYELCGGATVAVAMLLMMITNTEHPPAAGLALGLVLEAWSGLTLLIIVLASITIGLLSRYLQPWIRDLRADEDGKTNSPG